MDYFIGHRKERNWEFGLPVFSAPYYVDAYVYRTCPFEFVKKALMANYWTPEELLKYDTPYRKGVEYGKHFRMTKRPNKLYERPLYGQWIIEVKVPNEFMWYHHNIGNCVGAWSFCDEFVGKYGWASSNAHCQTITALKRRLGKWKLPIGAKVCALGVFDERYEFTIKK